MNQAQATPGGGHPRPTRALNHFGTQVLVQTTPQQSIKVGSDLTPPINPNTFALAMSYVQRGRGDGGHSQPDPAPQRFFSGNTQGVELQAYQALHYAHESFCFNTIRQYRSISRACTPCP